MLKRLRLEEGCFLYDVTNPLLTPYVHSQEYKGQPAWGFQHEPLSAGSRASSGADGCVPELTQGILSHVTIKLEACVPDYNTSHDGSPRMPPMQVQPANLCAE